MTQIVMAMRKESNNRMVPKYYTDLFADFESHSIYD